MNYEEKYKEALKRAESQLSGCKADGNKEGCEMLEYIFPELRESEDERIREGIIELVK